jgi:hypothetical protein
MKRNLQIRNITKENTLNYDKNQEHINCKNINTQ